MMGTEPYLRAMEEGAQVVLAGRSSDTSIFAAIPMQKGLPASMAWHSAKILECGAASVAVRRHPDGMMAWVREGEFVIEPPNPEYVCTPQSIASHTLYENAHPFLLKEPSGTLDVTNARYEAISDRAVRVWGSEFIPADTYTIKLEGAEMVGYQSVIVGSIRDPVMIRQLPELAGEHAGAAGPAHQELLRRHGDGRGLPVPHPGSTASTAPWAPWSRWTPPPTRSA